MSPDDDRIDLALARILEKDGSVASATFDAVVAEDPDLEAPLRARLRVLRMLDALQASRSGQPRASSVLASLSRTGRDVRPVSLQEPPGEASPPVVLPQSPSGHWGRYTVQGEIARGGVGIVFKARDPDLGRDVALKTLREEHASRPDVLQRFVEEAQIGGQLQHPGVVPVYELGLGSDGQPYFAMKLVKGKTLAHVLAERESPADDRSRLLSVFQAICQTVAYAHERRILHRDLKPSNVMVGSFGEVQVFDWGMAKVLAHGGAADDARTAAAEETEPASLVRTVRSASGSAPSVEGSVLGTPQYMAPEQARGEVDRLDERADVFSLGAILCEILTGKPPYTGTDREVLVQAAQARLEPAHERLAACGADPELVALAKRCLAPERADRPRDASVLAREITAHLASLEERARKAELAETEARVLVAEERRARRLTLSLSAAVLALVLVGGGGWTWIASQRRSRAEGVERQVERALADATRLRGQAEAAGTAEALPLWREALETARRAEALAASDDADPATRERVAAAMAEMAEAQHGAEAAAEQRRRDEAAAERLDEIRARYGETWDIRATVADYAKAFQEYLGGDVDALGVDEAARRIQASRIRERLILGLMDWMDKRGTVGQGVSILPELIVRVDTDPWRAKARKAVGNPEAIRALAAESDLDARKVLELLWLADTLASAGDTDRALAMNLEAWRRHPGDFWACFDLATRSQYALPPRLQEAKRYYTAALAIRPRSVAVRQNMGNLLIEEGRIEEAVREFRSAIRIDPQFAFAHVGLARALESSGDLGGAISALREALKLDSGLATAHINLAGALSRAGDRTASLAEANEAVRLAPESALAHHTLGNAHVESGDLDGAISEFHEALRLDPQMPLGHNSLGHALGLKGDRDGALFEFREALRIDTNDALAHGNLARALAAKGDYEGAILEAREAIRLTPNDATAHGILGGALREKGDLDGATQSHREAVRLAPSNPEQHLNLGVTLTRKGDLEGGIAQIREALRLGPTSALAHFNLGVALGYKGDPAGAIAAYRAALRLDPKHAGAHANLGLKLAESGDLDEGIAECRKAVLLEPHSADMHNNLGGALEKRGELKQAIEEYREALRLDPKQSGVLRNLGRTLCLTGDFAGAISHLREAIRIDPTDPTPHTDLGNVLGDAGDLEGSIAEYREAIRLNPRVPLAHFNLGNALHRQGDLQAAVTAYREAIRLDPKDADAHGGLALVFQSMGDPDGAILEYRESLRLDPTLAISHWNLALALKTRGKLRESLAALKQATELASQGKRVPATPAQQAQAVAAVQRLIAAADLLPAFARGEGKLTTAQDAFDMATAGYCTEAYAAASMAWQQAFTLLPSLLENLGAGHRYNAACAAALAGAGKGTDAATLDDAGRARWRKQALEWLRADLDAWKKVPDTKVVRSTLEHWKADADLAGVRDEADLAKRPAEEREACRALWRDVEAVFEGLSPPR